MAPTGAFNSFFFVVMAQSVFGQFSAKTRKSKMILVNLFKTNEDCSSHDAVLERIHLVCYYITTVLDKVFIPRKFKKELVYCSIDHVSCKVHEPS